MKPHVAPSSQYVTDPIPLRPGGKEREVWLWSDLSTNWETSTVCAKHSSSLIKINIFLLTKKNPILNQAHWIKRAEEEERESKVLRICQDRRHLILNERGDILRWRENLFALLITMMKWNVITLSKENRLVFFLDLSQFHSSALQRAENNPNFLPGSHRLYMAWVTSVKHNYNEHLKRSVFY